MRVRRLAWATVLATGAACGGTVVLGAPADSGVAEDSGGVIDASAGHREDGNGLPPNFDAGTLQDADATVLQSPDARGNDVNSGGDTGTESLRDALGEVVDVGQSPDASSESYVDAGYYYGDGSYFVDGGAFPDVALPGDAGGREDAMLPADASPDCSALAACCPSLQGATQSLCRSIVSQGNSTNCATELAQLQSGENCMGVSVLASQLQIPPTQIVSDGAVLFWVTNTGGLFAMSVSGGPIKTLFLDELNGFNVCTFLAVDTTNVYLVRNANLLRVPKNGDPATLVSAAGVTVQCATSLGGTQYWAEGIPSFDGGSPSTATRVWRAPLVGGPSTTIAFYAFPNGIVSGLAVTSSTVFVSGPELLSFPTSGIPASGPAEVNAGSPCYSITSDTNAVYCATNGVNLRITSDGTATTLGPSLNSSYITFDDTYAYWADHTTVGTIMKAPKAGGGAATIVARDTSPLALAVDDHSVYWADEGGYIKSAPK